jgi:Bacterial regulatory helix-turn-helix protein, lysR family
MFLSADKRPLSAVYNEASRIESCGTGAPMELDQVETFLAVAAFGGFHRAAEALRVTQPAVSARIKALEQSL